VLESTSRATLRAMKCILIAVLCAGILSCSPRPVAGARTDNKADGGYRFERNGWIYVHLEGAPERLGYQSSRGVPDWDWGRFFPGGTVQAKVIDGSMTEKMEMWAAIGHPCGPDFVAERFLAEHKEYEWARGLLRDMKTQPWTYFRIGDQR